jgi:hypothetical protein
MKPGAVQSREIQGKTVDAVVVGTVVLDAVLAALRRLAQENHSAIRFAPAGARSRSARRTRSSRP